MNLYQSELNTLKYGQSLILDSNLKEVKSIKFRHIFLVSLKGFKGSNRFLSVTSFNEDYVAGKK